jgi:hypothetical protein
MPLINLTTNLKSLKFGNDQFDGGSSNQPYIQTSIPDELGEYGFLDQDFILRGGSKAVTDSLIDVKRLGKYFTDTKNPSGILFVAKQNLLSRTAVRTQASGLLNEGVYTPLSTLIEAGGVAFGLHVNKQGLNPFNGEGSLRTYNDVVNPESGEAFSIKSIDKNRLVDLYKNNQDFESDTFGLDPVNVLKYQGGPGSILGIGDTNIKFADQRTGYASGKNIKTYLTTNIETDRTDIPLNYKHGLGLSNLDKFPIWASLNRDTENIFKDIIEFTSENPLPEYLPSSNYTVGNLFGEDEAKTYLTSPDHEQPPINYNNALGLSVYTSSDFFETTSKEEYTGINSQGQFLLASSETNKIISNYYSNDEAKTYLAYNNQPTVNYNNALGLSIYSSSAFFVTTSKEEYTGINPEGQFLGEYRLDGNVTIGNIGTEDDKTYLTTNSNTNRDGLPKGPKPKITNNNKGKVQDSYVGLSINPITPNPTDQGVYTYTQAQLNDKSIKSILVGREGIPTPKDFRKKLRDIPNFQNNAQTIGNLTNAPDYATQNIEQRVNLGDPGNRNRKNLTSYVRGYDSSGAASFNSYDRISALSIYKSSEIVRTLPIDDLVTFRIGVINNDTPDQKVYIHFRAFLNQITDAYTAEWNDTRYIGRGEKFYNYTGFDRKYSLSWTVAAQSKAELIPMYKKLNYLASVCAPDYSSAGYMRGNIVTLTVGGYLHEQPGIITGFSYEMNEDNATWEIGISDNESATPDTTVKQLPHLIKVTGFNFIPIHTFVPRLQQNTYNGENGSADAYGAERYIALEDDGGNNNYGPPPIPTPDPGPVPEPEPVRTDPVPEKTPVPDGLREDLTAVRDNTDTRNSEEFSGQKPTLKYPLPPKGVGPAPLTQDQINQNFPSNNR